MKHLDIVQHNATILEAKKELTNVLMDLESGVDVKDRIIKIINELHEIPYDKVKS